MEKVRKLRIIIMVLSSLEFIPLIIYYWLYVGEYSFEDFMEDFNRELAKVDSEKINTNRIRSAFEGLFHYYRDSTGTSILMHSFKSFAINTVIFGLIIAMLILQCPKTCKNSIYAKYNASIILLFIAFLIAIAYDAFAFEVKYKLDLNDDEIYIFSDKFNEEIKKNLNYQLARKINMIICVFLAQGAMITQAVLIILKHRATDKNQNVQMNLVQYPAYSPNAPINQPNMQGMQTI